LISLVGKVAGEQTRPLGGVKYRYPVLDISEFHVWVPERMKYPPPPPYYYDPYYYDPFFVNPYFYPYWYPYRYRVYPTPSPRLQEERKEKSKGDPTPARQ
ncbi:MAG TPA: Slp family lipoprotein, partial [Desulfuromonadales bacterium]|nr:Slp family lipoprotein [Desulfuromonadales bacterium]